MPRTHAYGLLDMFALVSRLLAPFVDPLRAEFAVTAIDRPRPTTPPQPAPTPEPVVPAVEPTADVPVSEPVIVFSITEPAPAITEPVKVITPAEPLFVRVGSGRGARYRADDGSTPGERYRRLVGRGGKARFTPVEARR